jgi:diguanylate cyclase (GGDEF)-like protein
MAAALTLAVCLTITTLAWASIVDVARQDAATQFDESADQAARTVENEIGQYTDRLRDVGTFVTTTGNPPPGDFRTYVNDSKLFEQLPAIVGVLYISRVPDSEMDQFLAGARQANPDFAVFDMAPSNGDVRYLLTYYAPGRVDLGLPIGTDVSAVPSVVDLITVSEAAGSGMAGSFQEDPFLQRVAGRNAFPMVDALLGLDFFIGVPVYAPGTEATGPPNEPVGWVAATIADFDQVAVAATVAVPDDLGMELTVELDGAGLTGRSDLSRVADVDNGAGSRQDAAFERSRSITVEGIDWTLAVWSSSDADALPSSSRIALAAGIVGSALAAGLVYVRLRARDKDRAYASDMAEREQFQREILDSVTNPMVVVDHYGVIIRTNPSWNELWATAGDLSDRPSNASRVGEHYLDIVRAPAVDGHDDVGAAVQGVLDGSSGTTDVHLALAVGSRGVRSGPPASERAADRGVGDATSTDPEPPTTWFSVRVTPLRGQRPGAIIIHTDVTEQKRSQDQLAVQAARDPLTGLANRATFEQRVEQALGPARESGHRIAVLFIDLDGFKPVNDTYGHGVGDDVLRTLGRRIDSVVRASDTAARLGGDEFVVLIDPLPDRHVAEATAERILSAMATPIRSQGHDINLAASIGVAVFEGPSSTSAVDLIERADAAMYKSKQRGGSRTTVSTN